MIIIITFRKNYVFVQQRNVECSLVTPYRMFFEEVPLIKHRLPLMVPTLVVCFIIIRGDARSDPKGVMQYLNY